MQKIKPYKPTGEIIHIMVVALLIFMSWSGILVPYIKFDIAIVAAIIGGYPLFKEAVEALLKKTLTVPVAMSIAIIAACLIGKYLPAAVVAFFVLIAEFFEHITKDKSRKAIRDLIESAPAVAKIKREGKEIEISVEQIRGDDIVIVKSGNRIPVDGRVIYGEASVNQAPITGESLPVDRCIGDKVFAGTINELGYIEVEVMKTGKDTTIGKIIELVEKSQANKAPVQRVADRFTVYFAPALMGISIITYLVSGDLVSAITVIVIACPCAIALATPLAVVASIGKATKKGILVKGGVYLEELSKANAIVIDKTGTLTIGEPQITDINCFADNHNKEDIITFAAILEKQSEHHLAKPILKKAEEFGINIPKAQSVKVISGKGITGAYNGQMVVLGNREILKENGIDVPSHIEGYIQEKEDEGKTSLILAREGEVVGVICVADVVREEARQAIKKLEHMGIDKLIMLTGDNLKTAQAIAGQVGIKEVFAEMLPEAKVNKVNELVDAGYKVIMVGDGINDAPALAHASVGIAMGSAGTDAAIEASDVALMTDDLTKILEVVEIGKKTFQNIKLNLAIGVIFNLVGVSLAAAGFLSPISAAIAHVIPDVLVFANSARLFR